MDFEQEMAAIAAQTDEAFEGDEEEILFRPPDDVFPDEEKKEKVLDYVIGEVERIISGEETQKMHDMWKKWRRQREARPEIEQKDYPWPGASNVTVPLALMNTNGIYAMLRNTFRVRKPFWTVEPNTQSDRPVARALQELINKLVESPHHIDMKSTNETLLYELASLGTQFVKVPWLVDRWQFKRTTPQGETVTVEQIRKDSPVVIPVRNEDFLCRPFYHDIQRAPLVGQRVWLFEHELLQRSAEGIYDGVDEVLEHGASQVDSLPDDRLEDLRRAGGEQNQGRDAKLYEIWELYMFEDVDDDGVPEDIILWVHPDSKTILRTEFNELGRRPWVNFNYLARPFNLFGVGVGWMSEGMQDETDALHNMRIDGTHIAMCQMYVTKRGSGIAPGETFRPLKNIQLDNPREDFQVVKFPDLGYGTVQAELLAKEYSDRATGASDSMMGFENRAISTRATATGTMFLAEQGSKVFHAIQESVESGFAEVAQIITLQLLRNKERVRENFFSLVDEEHHQGLEEFLLLEVEDVPTRFEFKVRTTDVDKTEEARRQGLLTLSQMYQTYAEKVFSLLPMIYSQEQPVPQQIQEVAVKFFVGSSKLMEKIFEFFGEQDSDDYVPYIRDLQMMTEMIEGMKDEQVREARDAQSDMQAMGGVGAAGEVVQGPGGGTGLEGTEGGSGAPVAEQ